MKLTIDVGVTDAQSFGTGSGVKSVGVSPVYLDDKGAAIPLFVHDSWNLTPAEQDASKAKTVRHALHLCVPCNTINKNEKRITLMFTVEDIADNVTVQFRTLIVDDERFADCC